MGTIVQPNFFIGDISIAQLGQASVNANLVTFINRYERQLLKAALGIDLYNDLINALKQDPVPQPYLDLVNGKQFTATGMWPPYNWQFPWLYSMYRLWFMPMTPFRTLEWVGFGAGNPSNPDTLGLVSPVANYIYYRYLRDQVTNNTAMGVVNSQAENATNASPAFKMADAFNQMSKDIFMLWAFIDAMGTDVYPSYNRMVIDYSFFKPINNYSI